MRFSAVLAGLGSFGMSNQLPTPRLRSTSHPQQGRAQLSISIPEESLNSSSGSGDLYMQIAGPSDFPWTAFGMGSSMSDATIFVIYPTGDGSSVTLSPRRSSGHFQPSYNEDVQVRLVTEGPGIAGGIITANFKCYNCVRYLSSIDGNADWI
ncbi:iron reductase domain protein [Aulographum hederae CBS 113979]|uniref:Iron reductase domain protein n=1 Tax=Aulographum hederae CBS 113979 TaxID=1176131 RepID=A0A6G1H4X5_9PEZI|nr:iron reductase domain protein [Aulographum hederae CBS 113979]